VSMSGIKGRPGGRPFAKGQSGNPGGRPIKPKTIEQSRLEHDVRMFARDRGAEAIDKLVALGACLLNPGAMGFEARA